MSHLSSLESTYQDIGVATSSRPERVKGNATIMRIHIAAEDTWQGKPLYQALLLLLRHEGVNGVTVSRGAKLDGASTDHLDKRHTAETIAIWLDLPLVIEVLESGSHLDKIFPKIGEMLRPGRVITWERVPGSMKGLEG